MSCWRNSSSSASGRGRGGSPRPRPGGRGGQAVIAAAQAGGDVVQAAANPNAPGPNIQTRVSEKKLGQATVDIGPDREHGNYQFIETGATYHEIKGAKRLLTFEGEQ